MKWQRCVVHSPGALTPALWACPSAEPNHFRQTGGQVEVVVVVVVCGGDRLYIRAASVSCCGQKADRGI